MESVDVSNRFFRYKSDVSVTWEAPKAARKVKLATEVLRADEVVMPSMNDPMASVFTGGALPADDVDFGK